MRTVIAVALVLLMGVFLLPLVFFTGPVAAQEGAPPPSPSPALPVPPASSGGAALSPVAADSDVAVRFRHDDGTVEVMTLGEYLWGVTAAEMPAVFAPEALKAQAVTARTFTLYRLAHEPLEKHPDADVCGDITCCQAYVTAEEAAANWGSDVAFYAGKITQAVTETDGAAILYGGEPIEAVFFSSAAGTTRDAQAVWGGAVPYLTAVPTPEGEEVPNYHTVVTVPLADFQEIIWAKYPDAPLVSDPTGWFTDLGDDLRVAGVVIPKRELRTMFSLRSATFTAAADWDKVTFSVTGYGHGVGLSQYGANAMAQAGAGYEEILTHYYTGVAVSPPIAKG